MGQETQPNAIEIAESLANQLVRNIHAIKVEPSPQWRKKQVKQAISTCKAVEATIRSISP